MNPAVVLVCWLITQAAADPQLRGEVLDASGAPIAAARVEAAGHTVSTNGRGAFSLPVVEQNVDVRVEAEGFAEYLARVPRDRFLRITLYPAGVAESVTVTARRSLDRLAGTASATSVMSAPVLLTSGSMTADDALRTVPGFSLFRRSSSRVANPTTQGVSLRGLAASGASRALVLADGVPLNDPFGGWVYWDRVPQIAIDRVEVVRGGSSAELYGQESIAGTVQILTIHPASPMLRISAEAGDHGLWRASLYGGIRHGRWSGFAAGERLVLDGFPIVATNERGPVDVDAALRYWNGLARASHAARRLSIGIGANWLRERRGNGTPLQRNDTDLRSFSVDARSVTGSAGAFRATAYAGNSDYNQSFSSVNATRTAETVTALQHVTSDYQGGSLEWASAWHGAAWLAGADLRHVNGFSADVQRGGRQGDYAAFLEIDAHPLRTLEMTAGTRLGTWSTTSRTVGDLSQRWIYLMPRVAVAWTASERVAITASWTSPGRNPTLNELYRDFQVGNVITRANSLLEPESANTTEFGVLLRHHLVTGRLVAFWTELDRAITNVTTASLGGRIARQRRNAGHIRARGIEAEGEWRPGPWASIAGSAAWLDSRFTSSDEPGLEGRRVSQVPTTQGALSLRLTPGRAVATLDWRFVGSQFDDDRNAFGLGGAQVVDIYAGARVRTGLQPFVAIENLFDVEVDVGRTPVRTVGTPRSIRAGVRMFLP